MFGMWVDIWDMIGGCGWDMGVLVESGRMYGLCIDRDGQIMLLAIFHVIPIKLKFQCAAFSKFNIAISDVNRPFFC